MSSPPVSLSPLAPWPDRICVAVHASTPTALFQLSTNLLPAYRFQELRLDYLPHPLDALAALQAHIAAHPDAVFLLTCRPKRSGGQWLATPEDEGDLLIKAARAGARWVDLSLESAEALGPQALHALRETGARLLLSWHDFHATGDLHAVLERMRPFTPDLRKIVPTARRLLDNLPLLELFHLPTTSGDSPIVGIAMGEAGTPSRIFGVRYGSAFTFAAPATATATAPGQLDADTLRDLYRMPQIGPQTRLFGVAGTPLRSSLSPLMLNTAFAASGIDAVDVPLLTESADELFHFAAAVDLCGCSVTMPLKQSALAHLGQVDPLAAQIGAVNTLKREPDGSYPGYNTDAAGITAPLQQRLSLRGAEVLVLGAGGAARAAVFGCLAQGAHVSILNRTYHAAESLAVSSGARAIQLQDLAGEPAFDVLIQATPAGMGGREADPLISLSDLSVRLVFDLVYNPLETPLLRSAEARGLETIPGVEMFLHQGARQFELWTGKPAPIGEMRRAVLEALRLR